MVNFLLHIKLLSFTASCNVDINFCHCCMLLRQLKILEIISSIQILDDEHCEGNVENNPRVRAKYGMQLDANFLHLHENKTT